MGDTTAIAWTDRTFNPWWGCTKVSPGCDGCYAERDAHRYGHDIWGKDADRRHLSQQNWNKPLKWDREAEAAGHPLLVFSGSMCDVFEPRPDLDADRARLFELIERTPHLIWQLLTKRPEQVLQMVPSRWLGVSQPDEMVQVDPTHRVPWQYATGHERRFQAHTQEAHAAWPVNVWFGTSVENQTTADLRISRLLDVPARVRFLSCEPLLGPVDLAPWLGRCGDPFCPCQDGDVCHYEDTPGSPAMTRPSPSLSWVIVGGESGAGHRPLDPDHARSLQIQCSAARVPFFFKQTGGTRGGDHFLRGEVVQAFPPQAGPRSEVAVAEPGRG